MIPKHSEHFVQCDINQVVYNDYIKVNHAGSENPSYGFFKGFESNNTILLMTNRPEYDYIKSQAIMEHLKLGNDARTYYRRKVDLTKEYTIYKLSNVANDPKYISDYNEMKQALETTNAKVAQLVSIVNHLKSLQ